MSERYVPGGVQVRDRQHGHAYLIGGIWSLWDKSSGKLRCPAHMAVRHTCKVCTRSLCTKHTTEMKVCTHCKTPAAGCSVWKPCPLHRKRYRCIDCHKVSRHIRRPLPVKFALCNVHKLVVRQTCKQCKARFRLCNIHKREVRGCAGCHK